MGKTLIIVPPDIAGLPNKALRGVLRRDGVCNKKNYDVLYLTDSIYEGKSKDNLIRNFDDLVKYHFTTIDNYCSEHKDDYKDQVLVGYSFGGLLARKIALNIQQKNALLKKPNQTQPRLKVIVIDTDNPVASIKLNTLTAHKNKILTLLITNINNSLEILKGDEQNILKGLKEFLEKKLKEKLDDTKKEEKDVKNKCADVMNFIKSIQKEYETYFSNNNKDTSDLLTFVKKLLDTIISNLCIYYQNPDCLAIGYTPMSIIASSATDSMYNHGKQTDQEGLKNCLGWDKDILKKSTDSKELDYFVMKNTNHDNILTHNETARHLRLEFAAFHPVKEKPKKINMLSILEHVAYSVFNISDFDNSKRSSTERRSIGRSLR